MQMFEEGIYNPDYVKRLFNRMSNSYERMNYITSFGFSIRWRTQFLKPLEESNDEIKIIDLLTGMGETWGAVKHRFPNSNLTALDFSYEMLKYAGHRNQSKFNKEITLIQQDILGNQLPSNHFDIVICAFGLKTFNVEQITVLANETKRILKEGGRFSFIEISKPSNKILKLLYGFYLGHIIPIFGKLLLGNPEEYRMLWRYTDKFENAKIAQRNFDAVGLKTEFISYFFGCATGFHGKKIEG